MPDQDDDIDGLVPEQDSADSILENLDSQGQPINVGDNEVIVTVPQQPSNTSSDLPFGAINVTSTELNERPTISVPAETVQSPASQQRVIISPTLLDDGNGELVLTSQGSQNRGDQQLTNNNIKFSSVEEGVQTVSPDFLNRHSSIDLDAYNEPPIVSSQSSAGNGSYPSLNEDAVSLPSSQGSYYSSGMNPDSPAGSQPSMYSVPDQFPSQSSQSSIEEVPGQSSQEIMDPLQTRARLF